MNRLESIKNLRGKISPTPWIYESKPVYDGIDLKERWIKGPTLRSNFPDDTPEGQTANADHEFIAASPEIVEYLLQEVESLQYKYDKYRETALNRIRYDEDRMNTLLQRLERYEKALIGVIEQSNSNNCNWCGDTVKVIAEEALKEERD